MALGIDFTFTQSQLRSLNKRLEGLVKRAGNLTPFFDDASAYMVNVVQNRIYRTKKGPDGEKWAPLAQSTIDIKGHSTILYQSGDLGRSIHVDSHDKSGFIIASNSPYGKVQNDGYKPTSGFIKGKTIPARPFMGISERNVKVISRMLKDHVAGRPSASQTGAFE